MMDNLFLFWYQKGLTLNSTVSLKAKTRLQTTGPVCVYKRDTLSPLATALFEQGIQDERTLSAISDMNRAEFVPHDLRHLSEKNHPLPIGFEQTISQPYIVGFMTQLANLTGDEKILEIGTGSGYQTAILSTLAKQEIGRAHV